MVFFVNESQNPGIGGCHCNTVFVLLIASVHVFKTF